MSETTKPTNPRAQARREEILSTACHLFAEKGYDAVSTKEISTAIGCAESLIFRYFPTKNAIYEALYEEFYETLKAPFVVPPLEKETGREWLDRFLTLMPDYKRKLGRPGLQEAVYSRVKSKLLFYKAYADSSDVVEDLLIPIFERGKADGSLPTSDSKKAACFFWTIYLGMNTVNTDFSFRNYLLPTLDEILKAVCAI